MGTDKEKYGINIVDIKLRIRTQTISKQVQNAHTLAISRNPACYLIKESKYQIRLFLVYQTIRINQKRTHSILETLMLAESNLESGKIKDLIHTH